MRPRIYILSLLFFALATFTCLQTRADDRGGADHHSDHRDNNGNDKKDKNNSDRNLPINTAIVALLVAGAGIGVISIKKASIANRNI